VGEGGGRKRIHGGKVGGRKSDDMQVGIMEGGEERKKIERKVLSREKEKEGKKENEGGSGKESDTSA